MRRSLLNKLNLPKPLRQTLVLITLLLLPSAAWGQWDTKTFIFNGCTDEILYADVDDETIRYSWNFHINGHYCAALVESKVKISVGDNYGKGVLTPPDGFTIKKVTLNYSDLQVTEGSKIYVRAVNRTDTTMHYTDPYLMTSDGTLDINLNDAGISSENLGFLIFSNDDKAYSYYLNSITITKIADYNLSIGDVHLTGSNVNPETGAVTDMAGVAFTPANAENKTPATLTLNNANFGPSLSGIVWSGDGTLKIQYSGNNIINTRNGNELNTGLSDGYCIFGNASSNLILSASDQASTLTLTPSYGGSTESNSRAAIGGFTSVEIGKTNGWGMYYTENYAEANFESLTAGEEVVIIKGTPLGISVAGVVVTNENQTNILGDGTVSFSPAEVVSDQPGTGSNIPATLTLNGATISGNIQSIISPLTVYLKGSSTITPSNTNDAPFQYTGTAGTTAATLTFESSEADDGELTLGGTFSKQEVGESDNRYYQFSSGNYTYSNPICAWYQKESFQYTRKTYTYWGVKGDNNNIIFYNAHYGITIGDYEVTKFNMDQVTGSTGDFTYVTDGSYLLVPNNNTLTGDYEIKSHRADLKIQISGDCTLKAIKFELNSEEFGTPSTKTLNISRTSTSTSGINSLTIDTGTDSSEPAISGFDAVNIDEEFHYDTPATEPTGDETKVVISDEVLYDLWVGGTHISSRNKDNILNETTTTPSVVFDESERILTFTGTSVTVSTDNGSAVVSGLENLTVKFVSSTVFQKGIEVTEFYGFMAEEGKTCNITFTAANEGSYFSIGTGAGNAISGFNKVTYNDGVAPYIWNENFRIAPVTLEKPTFIGTYDEDTGKLLSVKIKCLATSTIDSNTEDVDLLTYDIIYTIDGGSETAYSDTEPITISGPCTLTAKTIFGNTSSDVATGKYFGAKQEVFTVAIGDKIEGTSWFTPEIKADDQIESEFMTQEVDESGIFEREGEGSELYLVAKKSGTTTVNASLWCEKGITTVLNSNIALTFNVGESLSSVFEGENTYGAIYSETAIQVPEGMTAYVITGIDEETGTVKTESVDFIPASTAVLLEKGTDAIAMTHVPYTGTATAPTNNKLNYSDPNSPAKPSTTDNWYVLYNNKFVKVTTNTEVKGGKCYLNLNGTAAGTRGFYNIGNGEGTTAIREVKNGEVNSEKWGNGEWFDLQGRRLSAKPNKSGLYILNGKKIVIK